jgi:hypothetical protein
METEIIIHPVWHAACDTASMPGASRAALVSVRGLYESFEWVTEPGLIRLGRP